MAIESRARWVLVACARKRNLLLFAILGSLAVLMVTSIERAGANDGPAISIEDVGPEEVTVVWTADDPAELIISYGETTAFGNAWISPPPATEHRARLSGLTCGTVYFFNVVSTANGVSNIDHVSDFRTAGCPRPTVEVTEPALQVGDDSAQLSWTASEPTSALLLFGLDTSFGNSVLVEDFKTEHSIVMDGLVCDTTYVFALAQTTESGLEASTGNRTFTTDPCETELVVTVSTGANDAHLSFTTTENVEATVLYGADVTFGASAVSLSATEHEVRLDGLDCGQSYVYVVQTSAQSTGLGRFVTDACANRPQGVRIDVSSKGALVRWSTAELATSTVLYGPTEAFGGAATNTLGPTLDHVTELSDLECDTEYHVLVQIETPGGVVSTSDSLALRTDPCHPAILEWTWASTNVGGDLTVDVTDPAYLVAEVSLSGQPIRTTVSAGAQRSHTWSVDGLTCGLTYEVDVELFGLAGGRGRATYSVDAADCELAL